MAKVYGAQKPGGPSLAGAVHLAMETEKIARKISPQRDRPSKGYETGEDGRPRGTVPVGGIFHLLPEADSNMQSRINTRVQHLGPGLDDVAHDRYDDRYDGEFGTLGPHAGCFLALGSGLGLVGTVSARR